MKNYGNKKKMVPSIIKIPYSLKTIKIKMQGSLMVHKTPEPFFFSGNKSNIAKKFNKMKKNKKSFINKMNYKNHIGNSNKLIHVSQTKSDEDYDCQNDYQNYDKDQDDYFFGNSEDYDEDEDFYDEEDDEDQLDYENYDYDDYFENDEQNEIETIDDKKNENGHHTDELDKDDEGPRVFNGLLISALNQYRIRQQMIDSDSEEINSIKKDVEQEIELRKDENKIEPSLSTSEQHHENEKKQSSLSSENSTTANNTTTTINSSSSIFSNSFPNYATFRNILSVFSPSSPTSSPLPSATNTSASTTTTTININTTPQININAIEENNSEKKVHFEEIGKTNTDSEASTSKSSLNEFCIIDPVNLSV